MYKYLILLLVIVSVDCHCRSRKSSSHRTHHRPQRYNNRLHEKNFGEIASNVISADLKYYEFCDGKRNTQIKENYGQEFYILKYSLPEYKEEDVTVNVKHRVMNLIAQRQKVFKDIRILPQMVKARDGKWYKDDDYIIILFPYKTDPNTETTASCDAVDTELRKLNRLVVITNEEVRSLDPLNNQTDYSGIVFSGNY